MKRILTTAVLAMAVSAAWGQAAKPQAPAAEQKSATEASGTMQAEAAKPQAQVAARTSAVARKPNPRRFEDARHCLEKGTNTEIIKCAEVYL
jgi:hypothetical protein